MERRMSENADFGLNRSAPYAAEAEEAVLGCVLINPDAYFEVAAILKPDDFYLHKHRWIWNAFTELSEQKLTIDIITVSDALEQHKQLGEVGGAAYLTRLINTVPTSLHAEAYGRIVQREAIRRRMIEAATQVAKLAYDQETEIGKLVADASAVILAVKSDDGKGPRPVSELAPQYFDTLKAVADDPSLALGLQTGLVDLDQLTGGLYKSDLIIVAGRPGAGKTAMMLTLATGATRPVEDKPPKNAVIFSLEMPWDQLVMRMVAGESQVEIKNLRRGDIKDNEWPILVQAHGDVSSFNIFIDDTPALTPMQLRAKCHRLMAEYGLDLVLVDYLQIMGWDGRIDNRVQQISYISRTLKQVARELEVPLVAGAQLNRQIEHRQDKKPVLADLRESGAIEQDADSVYFLWPTDNQYVMNLTVAKQRNGTIGDILLYFRKQYGRFENAETRHVDLVSL
jgi:replicative DNA helicase